MYRYLVNNHTFFEISFSKDYPVFVSDFNDSENGFIKWLLKNPYLPLGGFQMKFELIELHNIKSPSEIVLDITKANSQTRGKKIVPALSV